MNLVYIAKPTYGGWVTFTAHLSHTINAPIYKISKRNETKQRSFGYNCSYQNVSIDTLCQKDNLCICALDKHYYQYLPYFPNGTKLVIHDPTELKTMDQFKLDDKSIDISKFKIITIRETVQSYLKNKFSIQSTFKYHPFYLYPKSTLDQLGYPFLSISRIDFDKHQDIILKANKELSKTNKIWILGKENRLYVHHKLKDLQFHDYWLGKYPKTMPMSFNNKDILDSCQFVIDLSIIKQDGGGTQYTFLEAIYHDCILVLHKEWVDQGNIFKDGYNCLVVSTHDELKTLIETDFSDEYKQRIIQNSKILLDQHANVDWNHL